MKDWVSVTRGFTHVSLHLNSRRDWKPKRAKEKYFLKTWGQEGVFANLENMAR